MNTSNQPESERLQKLAEFDKDASDGIRQALPSAAVWPLVEPAEDWRRECRQWLGKQSNPDVVMVLGAGPAGEMQFLMEQLPPQTRLFMMEKDPAPAAALFRNWSMEELVAEGRLNLALGENIQDIEDKFRKMIDIHNPPSIAIYGLNQTAPEIERFYYNALQHIRKGMRISTFNVGTLVHHGPLWQFNSLKNLPLLIANPGVNKLFGAFSGRAAMIVGAGPSLNDALPFLKRNAHKFVILAAATALRPLREAGIRPDLVVAVDASRKTAMQFTAKCDDLFLACSTMAYPPALQKFRGLFSAQMSAIPIDKWMEIQGQEKGSWVAAGTVTSSALDLAVKMGCDPIISMGFDLSFADNGTTHANKTMYQGARLDPRHLVQVPGNYKATVPTTEQFRVYIDLLQSLLQNLAGKRFINATTGGARIEGMELQHPAILDEMPDSDTSAYDLIAQAHAGYKCEELPMIRDNIEQAARHFDEIIGWTQQAARLCNRLIMILKSPCAGDEDIARDYLKQLDEIDQKFADTGDSSLLLDMSLWPANFKADNKKAGEERSAPGAIQTNRQSREVYEQIVGATKWTKLLVLEIIEEINRGIGQTGPAAPAEAAHKPAAMALQPA